MIWVIVITAVVAGLITGGGVYILFNTQINTGTENKIVEYNCKASGGTIVGDKCKCPDEELGPINGFTYDKDTGYCVSSEGTPGGQLGEEARKLLEYEILKNK